MGLGRLVLLGVCGLALAAADPSPSQRDAAEVFPLLMCAHACAPGERERRVARVRLRLDWCCACCVCRRAMLVCAPVGGVDSH